MQRQTAAVIGVGALEGLGTAVSRRFAREGFHVLVAGRTAAKIERVAQVIRDEGGHAEAVLVDATSESDVMALFDHAMTPTATRAPLGAVVFNAGNNLRIPLRELSAETFEEFWRVGCFAGFLVGREAARRMTPLGRGTVLFTGASGSLRGRPDYAHFAAAKAGLRMLSQSMAREFGPLGLHVAHIVVDGGINGARLKENLPDRVAELGEEGMLDIDAIAEMYWQLHAQPKSAWTQ